MKNEYGVRLDSNGYAPSIMDQRGGCYVCGEWGDLARHEVFHGFNRQKSKAYGLWVLVCPKCHDEIHMKRHGIDGALKHRACKAAKEFYNWTDEDFRQRFGKDYWNG